MLGNALTYIADAVQCGKLPIQKMPPPADAFRHARAGNECLYNWSSDQLRDGHKHGDYGATWAGSGEGQRAGLKFQRRAPHKRYAKFSIFDITITDTNVIENVEIDEADLSTQYRLMQLADTELGRFSIWRRLER